METCCPQQNQSPNAAAPHREPRSATAPEQLCVARCNRGDVLVWTYVLQVEFPCRRTSQTPFLADTEQQMLQDLMSEAMEENEGQHTSGLQQNGKDFAQCQRIKGNASPYAILSMSAGAREEQNQDHDPPRSDLFLFPDESGNLTQDLSPTYPVLHSPLITPVPNLAQEADDFCILETPGSRREVRTATFLDSQHRQSVSSVFSCLPSTGSWSGTGGKAAYFRSCGDQSWPFQSALMWEWLQPRGPELSHPRGALPHQGDLCCLAPLWREGLQERSFNSISFQKSGVSRSLFRCASLNKLHRKQFYLFYLLLLHFRSTPHSSPSQTPVRQVKSSSRTRGGRGRNTDVLMEIQLSKVSLFTCNKCLRLYIYHIPSVRPLALIRFSLDPFKVRFQHDVYPQARGASGPAVDQPVSRQVFVVQDLEIRDRLAASQMNKFLYLYSSKEMPRKSHSNMVRKPSNSPSPARCWHAVIFWTCFFS